MRLRIAAVFGKHYGLDDLSPRLLVSIVFLLSFGPCRSIVVILAAAFCAFLALKETNPWAVRVAFGNVVTGIILRNRLRFLTYSASSQVLVRRCRGIVYRCQLPSLRITCCLHR